MIDKIGKCDKIMTDKIGKCDKEKRGREKVQKRLK